MLTEHTYWGSKQCIKIIWIYLEASTYSGQTTNRIEFRLVEVQWALNRHEEFNPMQWLGLEARITLMVTCTPTNCFVLTLAFSMVYSLCTSWIGQWRKSDIVFFYLVTNFRWELTGYWLICWAETAIQIPALRALLIEICSHNPF